MRRYSEMNVLTMEENKDIINVRKNVRLMLGVNSMKAVNITQARKDIYNIVHDTIQNHEPVQILSKNGNAVLVSENDWRAIEETLYLVSIPGMAQSIIDGMNTPVEECEEDINWEDIE